MGAGHDFAESWKKPFQHSIMQKTATIVLELVVLWFTFDQPWRSAAEGPDPIWYTIGLGALAIINFIVFFQADSGPDGSIGETRGPAMRRAIAGSVVLTYVMLVAIVAFNPDLQQVAGANAACEPPADGETAATCVALTRDLINRLGVVVIAVVGFYFGTSTLDKYLEEIRGKQNGGGDGGGNDDAGGDGDSGGTGAGDADGNDDGDDTEPTEESEDATAGR